MELLTQKGAAAYVGVAGGTFSKIVCAEDGPIAVHIATRRFFRPCDLDDWLLRRRGNPQPGLSRKPHPKRKAQQQMEARP